MSLESSHCPSCWHGHPVPLSSAGPSQRCCGDATTACSLPCCEGEAGEAKPLRKSHLHQPLLSSGSQCELAQPWEGAQTCLTWGIRHWGARLWTQGPAGPVCPHCSPSWKPLGGPAGNTAPLPPAPEGHKVTSHTMLSLLQQGAALHPWVPIITRGLEALLESQGCRVLGGLDPSTPSTLAALQHSLLVFPAPGTPESKLGFERAPQPKAWTHHCRDLCSRLFLWSLCSLVPLVCLALGNRERGQSTMMHCVQGSCQ